MKAIMETQVAEIVAIADASRGALAEAAALAPEALQGASLEDVLRAGVDGIVIATPTALHAEQSIRALRSGVAVFCQKPLGRTAAEVGEVVDAARRADRFLAVDLSYRYTEAMQRIRDLVREGALGRVYAADLVFHNAYGPDKAWFYDSRLSGGGCVMDLGVHLVDLALWTLDFPKVHDVRAHLYCDGEATAADSERVENYAVATLQIDKNVVVRIACSWRLSAGRDAVISAHFYGTGGGAALRNLNGSFYDFEAERYHGTACERIAEPPDGWFGRAAADWARRLARGERFDRSIERLIDGAAVLDCIYGRSDASSLYQAAQ